MKLRYTINYDTDTKDYSITFADDKGKKYSLDSYGDALKHLKVVIRAFEKGLSHKQKKKAN